MHITGEKIMIFIKNKKAWKEFVKQHPDDLIEKPKEFCCYLYIAGEHGSTNFEYRAIYQFDAQSMLEKLENGREF